MEKFEIKFNDSAETYGSKIGMTQEQELALIKKLDDALVKFREDPEMNNSGQLFQRYLECATSPEEAILAACLAGETAQKMLNPLGALLGCF